MHITECPSKNLLVSTKNVGTSIFCFKLASNFVFLYHKKLTFAPSINNHISRLCNADRSIPSSSTILTFIITCWCTLGCKTIGIIDVTCEVSFVIIGTDSIIDVTIGIVMQLYSCSTAFDLIVYRCYTVKRACLWCAFAQPLSAMGTLIVG